MSKRDTIRAARVKMTAECIGIKPNTVEKVLRGERENKQVLPVMMAISEGQNKLIEEVKKLIPFD